MAKASDAVKVARIQLARDREDRRWQLVKMVVTNPIVELITAAVVLAELEQRSRDPNVKHFFIPPAVATIVGGTVGAAVVAQQLGPGGVSALGAASADVLKGLGALALVK